MNKEEILLEALNTFGNFTTVTQESNENQLEAIYEAMELVNEWHKSEVKKLNLSCAIKAEGEPLLDGKYIAVKVKAGSMIIALEDAKRISNGL